MFRKFIGIYLGIIVIALSYAYAGIHYLIYGIVDGLGSIIFGIIFFIGAAIFAVSAIYIVFKYIQNVGTKASGAVKVFGERKQATRPMFAVQAGVSTADELQKWAVLLEKGLISTQEYENARKELLRPTATDAGVQK
ncbi:SHOCT domain-containing protein [Brevundimonas pishanensis]|uniref:SHOCT domain-containing protein n=1 Tax=Brevundimonas pishanensis TaxID=2896315 RepID=UPI001FA813C7|nr:SHOCT domain-containing protein [Brevundimonas pishanensis]